MYAIIIVTLTIFSSTWRGACGSGEHPGCEAIKITSIDIHLCGDEEIKNVEVPVVCLGTPEIDD